MTYAATTDPIFLRTLEAWLRVQPEILVLFRYSHAAGSRDYEFFTSFQGLADRLRQLAPRTCVIAFRKPQLPLRGIVDDAFISNCLTSIPKGSEYLVVETTRQTYGQCSWFHHDSGLTHEELRADLEESRGVPVAAGLHPPWLEDNDDVISAVVPEEDGRVVTGIY
jgi:hypothetical protein